MELKAMNKGCSPARLAAMALSLIILSSASLVSGQYVIGPDDILGISFWQNQNLNTEVAVNQDGKITLDIVGEVTAAGKTTDQLQNDIVRLMTRLNKSISQAVVRVVQYNYNYVFMIGQVTQPGKRTFEQIPDLWTLINESGGITATADLSRVTIIRSGQDAGRVEVVDVREAIASGTLDRLPRIRRMDTIDIPPTPALIQSGDLATSTEKKNLIYVVGAVITPGPIRYEENLDVLEALAMAGGPSENADLKHAQVVIKDGFYAQTINFDLNNYVKKGRPARYILQREDTFIVPARRGGFLGVGLPTVVAALGAITSFLIIYDNLSRNDAAGGI